jgi:MFS family permease
MKDVFRSSFHFSMDDPHTAGPASQGWLVILPLIAVTAAGGLLLFRLLVRRKGRVIHFELNLLDELVKERRAGALYLLGSICLVLVVLTDCSLHALIKHGALFEPDSLSFLLLPLSIALMAITTFVLRVAVEEIQSDRAAMPLAAAGKPPLLERYLQPLGERKDRVLLGLVSGSLFATLIYGAFAGWQVHQGNALWQSVFAWSLTPAYALTAGLFWLAMTGLKKTDGARRTTLRFFTRRWVANHRLATLLVLGAFSILLAWVTGFGIYDVLINALGEYKNENNPISPTSPLVVGIVICATFVIFEIKWGAGNNRRPLWLFTAAYVILVALCSVNLSTEKAGDNVYEIMRVANVVQPQLAQAVIGLVAAALAWVVGLGWMADPNAYSMHLFYKARLVRAYLGASNYNRRKQRKEITEAVAGDNLLIKEMRNCYRGAPYHLINTTLNLVAARDLATAQRSAASFVLSQLACGSSRTGYRNTEKYMEGRLSLGTAMAVSGAAASPNMGSRTPSTALAMLMTILNVRLGYWAPTPHRRDWQSPRTRLWPFYLLREFLSGTNDVSDHCYLTDGGHFDNTGLYSLIERGCRYIVVVDCGADPNSSFNDLGNAIRRCRIDFDAEINLNIAVFKKLKSNRATSHFVEGSICYSPAHLRSLNGGNSVEKERLGRIILIKPSLLADNVDETADVRQYSIQNEDFPQQTTTNQWFDEAQFESYRRLGRICTASLFGSLDHSDSPGPDEDDSTQERRETVKRIKKEDGSTRKRREAVKRIKNEEHQVQIKDIRDLFKDPSKAPLV